MLNKNIKAEVLGTQMTMKVRLETGEVVTLAGNAARGSELMVMATGVSRDGLLMGYEGYVPTFTPKPSKTFTELADSAGFEEVKVAS